MSARTRPIRLDQFKKQLEDIGIDNLQEIQLSKEESVFIRLGNSIDAEDAEDFQDRIRNCVTSKDVAMVILDYYPERSAEEQWAMFEKAGGTADTMALLFRSATQEQQDALGKLKPRKS